MVGKFIIFEGIDGSGKSTQIKKLADFLFDSDKKNIILLTREPTKISPAGLEMRKRLAADKNPKENAEVYTKLYIEDRNYHIEHIIKPALEKGITVLCDRYKHSTIVYQQAQGMNPQKLIDLHRGMPIPDLTIIIDVPVKTALLRMNRKKDVFEKADFLEELRNGYLNIPKYLPDEKIITIDGTKSPEKVQAEIQKAVNATTP